MANSIALRSVAGRAGIGRRQIAGRSGQANQGYVAQYPPGSYTFTPPKAGYWKFVLFGAGYVGATTDGGDSGAYCEITTYLSPAQPVALVAGVHNSSDTTATFSNGKVVTAGRATGTSGTGPGQAAGGDVNLNGSAGYGSAGPTGAAAGLGTGGGAGGAGVGGGAGGPANLPFRGGAGVNSSSVGPFPPGVGGYNIGGCGDGLIIVMFVRP